MNHDNPKPLCHVCQTNRLTQEWDVIERAYRLHQKRPVCSQECGSIADAAAHHRRSAKGRKKLSARIRVRRRVLRAFLTAQTEPAPDTPPRRPTWPEFSGEGISTPLPREREMRVAESRAAADTWIAGVSYAL